MASAWALECSLNWTVWRPICWEQTNLVEFIFARDRKETWNEVDLDCGNTDSDSVEQYLTNHRNTLTSERQMLARMQIDYNLHVLAVKFGNASVIVWFSWKGMEKWNKLESCFQGKLWPSLKSLFFNIFLISKWVIKCVLLFDSVVTFL